MGVGDGRGEEWEGVFSSRHSQGGAAGGEKRCQCCFFLFRFFFFITLIVKSERTCSQLRWRHAKSPPKAHATTLKHGCTLAVPGGTST